MDLLCFVVNAASTHSATDPRSTPACNPPPGPCGHPLLHTHHPSDHSVSRSTGAPALSELSPLCNVLCCLCFAFLSLSLSLSLPVSLSLCLSVCLSLSLVRFFLSLFFHFLSFPLFLSFLHSSLSCFSPFLFICLTSCSWDCFHFSWVLTG